MSLAKFSYTPLVYVINGFGFLQTINTNPDWGRHQCYLGNIKYGEIKNKKGKVIQTLSGASHIVGGIWLGEILYAIEFDDGTFGHFIDEKYITDRLIEIEI
jgi:hypothetical protein